MTHLMSISRVTSRGTLFTALGATSQRPVVPTVSMVPAAAQRGLAWIPLIPWIPGPARRAHTVGGGGGASSSRAMGTAQTLAEQSKSTMD
jgi:hypothetical protein